MHRPDDSLQIILDDILSEYADAGKKVPDSAMNPENEEIREIASKLATVLLNRLKLGTPPKLETRKVIENEFDVAVLRTWRKPFDLLDLLLYTSLEVASEFSLECESETASKHSFIQMALASQQTNACLVFNEVIHLLKSGFPSGAHSHWRTLHEMACISYFISEHGEDVAKRYIDYEVVETYFQAQAIYEHQQKMECNLLSKREFKTVKRLYKEMRKTYGADFVKKASYPYGWVPRTVLKTRSLREIEKSVKLDVLRPYYDLANYNAFGRPKGLMFKLATMKKERKGILAVGPTNYGLADPGMSAAISLGQITACLLLSESTIKRVIIVDALRNLVDEICDAFSEIQAEFSKS